jgi:hypothetical protein
MAIIQTRATLGDLGKRGLGPDFKEVFDQNLVRYDGMEIAQRIFAFESTTDPVFRTTGLTGFGLLEEFEEGTPMPEGVNIKTFETLYNIKDYGKGITVTDDCLKDRARIGKKLDEMAGLAKSAEITPVKGVVQILNGGFATTSPKYGFTLSRYTSEALFYASHARADGGTAQSNVSASSIALTELNLETARLALVKQLTDNGLPILLGVGQIYLVVPDVLEKNAVIYTNSTKRASTANNDLNFYEGNINVISSRWLDATHGGSATAWFLVTSIAGLTNPLRCYRMGGPEFYESQAEARTLNKFYGVKNRMTFGNSEWKGTWGSAGA